LDRPAAHPLVRIFEALDQILVALFLLPLANRNDGRRNDRGRDQEHTGSIVQPRGPARRRNQT
jgi:hypothetical protein